MADYLEVEDRKGTLVVRTGFGKWEVTNNQPNKKLCLIFIRMLQDPKSGRAIYTYQQIADAFGYADRRNVHNYWQEFMGCEGKFLDFLLRKRKVDAAVVEAVSEQLQLHIPSSVRQLCAQTNERLGRCDLTVANIHTALEHIPCTVIRNEVVSKWEEGSFHPREETILEEALSALEGQDKQVQREHRVRAILCKVGIEPSEDQQQDEVVQQGQWDAVSDLLRPDLPVANLSERIRQMVFALDLYYWNVPLSRIGLWLGVGKSTVYGWIIGLTQALWAVISVWLVSRVKASRICIDEKWIKIQGKWHYWFVALDQATGLPILGHLLPTRTKWACRWFLIKLKRMGKYPLMIITDGLPAYISSIAKTFSQAKHVLCVFHYQQGVSRWVKQNVSSVKTAQQVKKKMKRVIQTQDVRTVKRRLKKLEAEDATHKWGISSWVALAWKRLTGLIPALRSNSYPKTTNTIERFFRAFQRFYKTRGGFHSVVSAKRELILFLVVYLFTQQTKTRKAPIETIVPAARRMPLYRLLNHPFECGMPTIPFSNKGLGKMATKNLMEPG